MPRVPIYEPGQITPTVDGGPQMLRTRATPEDMGAGFGESLQHMGEFVRQAQHDAFQLRRAEIMNKLADRANELTKNGLMQKGQQAADPQVRGGKALADEAADDLKQTYEKLKEGLTMSAQMAAVLDNDFADIARDVHAKLTGHSMRELEKWRESEFKTSAQQSILAVQQTADLVGSPVWDAVALAAKEQLVARFVEHAKSQGLDAEGARMEALSMANSILIEGLFDKGEFGKAKELYDNALKNGGLTPKDSDRLSKFVNEGASVHRGRTLGMDLFKQFERGDVTEKQAYERMFALEDARETQHAVGVFKQMQRAAEATKVKQKSDLLQALYEAHGKGEPTASVLQRPEYLKLVSLDAELADKFADGLRTEDWVRTQRSKALRDDDDSVSATFRALDSEAEAARIIVEEPLGKWTKNELVNNIAKLLPKHRTQVIEVWTRIQRDPSIWKPAKDAILAGLAGSKYMRNGKPTPEGAAMISYLTTRLFLEARQTGIVGKTDPAEISEKVRHYISEFVLTPSTLGFGGESMPVAEMGKILDNPKSLQALLERIPDSFKDRLLNGWANNPKTRVWYLGADLQTLNKAVARRWVELYQAGKIDKNTFDIVTDGR